MKSPGSFSYYYKVGALGKTKKSNIFEVIVTKCGAEKIDLANNLDKKVKEYELGSKYYGDLYI